MTFDDLRGVLTNEPSQVVRLGGMETHLWLIDQAKQDAGPKEVQRRSRRKILAHRPRVRMVRNAAIFFGDKRSSAVGRMPWSLTREAQSIATRCVRPNSFSECLNQFGKKSISGPIIKIKGVEFMLRRLSLKVDQAHRIHRT